MMPLLPLVLLVPAAGGSDIWLLGMAPLMGYLLGWGMHNDLAYDGTPFWLHVSTGVAGRADRIGRLVPTAALGLVLVPGYAVLSSALTGRWQMLPADLGAGLGLLLAGFGIASVVERPQALPGAGLGRQPVRQPARRDGAVAAGAARGRGCRHHPQRPRTGAVAGRPRWVPAGWGGPACSWRLVLGAICVLVGVRQGARIYERRAPDLLSDLTRIR